MPKKKKTLKERILSPLEKQITKMMLSNYAVYVDCIPDHAPRISFEDWCMLVRDDMKANVREVADFEDCEDVVPYPDLKLHQPAKAGLWYKQEQSL